ncbi:hypothetical protein D8Y22_17675 [Salinadaptatus halalkaliphilus]|uniref:DUF7993 domain-containing protein n=1 Tax=Salinadaptatus halalkaliphilus TaxID=2419781 RepID=A0A4S3TI85_9EURY|nr:hypothetical protein [Salinadaptatus halalkaliphilus]THE63642.1 hypothetical protein D8Y22_17675 [Salinadaptatus halalkaliphilus]
MVEEQISDGKRIAQLLASELEGRNDGGLEAVVVTNADRDVEPTADGARAYDIAFADTDADPDDDAETGRRFASVFVQDDRARLEVETSQETAAETARKSELRVRPKATEPPRTLVFVENGAAVKRAADVVQAVVRDARDS